MFDWADVTLRSDSTEPPGWSRFLLVRRSLTRDAQGERELAPYLCCAPAATPDEELIRAAGTRWRIDDFYRWHLSSCAAFYREMGPSRRPRGTFDSPCKQVTGKG